MNALKAELPNVYLDIDGVLLANEDNLAIGADEFIKYAVDPVDFMNLVTAKGYVVQVLNTGETIEL